MQIHIFINLWIRSFYFPNITCASNPETAGTGKWIYFSVQIPNTLIYHKTNFGYMDLTFHNRMTKQVYFEVLEKYIAKMGFANVKTVATGKSMSFRIVVPVINFDNPFEEEKSKLDECFSACERLTELAKIISYFAEICEK